MKKTILNFVLLLSLMACTTEKTVEYSLLSGKINNIDTKEIILTKVNQSSKKKIAIDQNGFFLDTIKTSAGSYLLTLGKNKINIYLNKGSEVNITADSKDFNNSLNISGKGSGTTKYLLLKKEAIKIRTDKKSFYSLEEIDFKNTAKNLNSQLNKALDTIEGIDATFKALEKKEINYSYLLDLSEYTKGLHSYWAKKNNYTPSNGFLDEVKTLDVTNEKDFKTSNTYKQLVVAHYLNKAKDLSKKDSISLSLARMKVNAIIPNQTIKNELIFSGTEYGMLNVEDFEEYYQIFINASTNEYNNAKVTKVYNKLLDISKGKPSPKFIDYEKHSGGTLSLDDLKGKYVYIDIWATWCIPCLNELPYLKKIEKAYHGKHIYFLSLSIDAPKDYDKWKQMVIDEKLGSVQVIADKGGKSKFIDDYFIVSIPRFILLDPEGKIVSNKAPRPSSPELIDLFNELNI